jgi:hypothetical protein
VADNSLPDPYQLIEGHDLNAVVVTIVIAKGGLLTLIAITTDDDPRSDFVNVDAVLGEEHVPVGIQFLNVLDDLSNNF